MLRFGFFFFLPGLVLFSACGDGFAVSPGEGAPLTSVTPLPSGLSILDAISSATPVDYWDISGVSAEFDASCADGGKVHVKQELSADEFSMSAEFTFDNCGITLLLGTVEYRETLNGRNSLSTGMSGGSFMGGDGDFTFSSRQDVGFSLGGDLGFAVECGLQSADYDFGGPYQNGNCRIFDAAGTEILVKPGDVMELI